MILPVTFQKWNPRPSDNTYTLTFTTQEITDEQIIEFRHTCNSFGVLYFRGVEKLSKEEIKELDKLDIDIYDEPKTQSQRLRSVLYLNWQKDNKGYDEFKDYYKFETERVIQHYKNKLD